MINPKNKLTVFHFDGASYTSYSRKAASFGRDSFTMTLETDDYLYVGFTKPINALYTNFVTSNVNTSVFTMEYYNGTTWTSVSSFDDDTEGYSRSAFFQWDRGLEDESVVQPDASMPTQYYYRISTDVNTSALEIQGMNLLFSDDEDLKREFPCVLDSSMLLGNTSHVLLHESSRDEIVQRFRNKGFNKREGENTSAGRQDIIPWDLLNIQEVREGSKFLALSKAFFNVSDDPDDIFHQKSLYYRKRYEDEIAIAFLTLDEDNDGKVDDNEQSKKIKHDRMTR